MKPDRHILIIDWPQYVTKAHPKAQQLLTRDVENILLFFKRKQMVKAELEENLAYVAGTGKMAI